MKAAKPASDGRSANKRDDPRFDLATLVAELQQLAGAALQRRWRSLVGGAVPANLGRPLTLRILAYKLQAQYLGDLDKVTLRELSTLYGAAGKMVDPDMAGSDGSVAASINAEAGGKPSGFALGPRARPARRIVRPGTMLMREHGGVQHRVMILDEGVAWNGRTYDSLSQVAYAITGTKWNGPRFFGLRDQGEDASKGQPKLKHATRTGKKNVVIGRGRAANVGRSLSQRGSP